VNVAFGSSDYLGRNTYRVAISNERIARGDGGEVVFRGRGDPESGRMRVVRLPGAEFIDRFLQHVLPAGFKRIRHYGLLSPARKKEGLAAARRALGVPPPQLATIESVDDFLRRIRCTKASLCLHRGGGTFRFVATLRPERHPLNLRGLP